MLLGGVDGASERPRSHRRHDVGQRVVRVRRLDERLVERGRAGGSEGVDALAGVVVSGVDGGVVGADRHEGVGDERRPLAPVVVGGEVADDAEDGVGVAEVVVGDVRQALDLANDVVAEEADDPAVQRREVRERRAAQLRAQRLDGGEGAAVGRDRDGQGALDVDVAAPHDERRHRVAADEAPAAPALVVDRLEQEAGAVADHPQEAGDRCREIGEDVAPDGNDDVVAGEGAELVAAEVHVTSMPGAQAISQRLPSGSAT